MQVLPAIPPVRPPPQGGLLLHFGPHDRLQIKRITYIVVDSGPWGYVLARPDNPVVTETITRDQMETLRQAPDFRHDRDFYRPGAAKARLISGVANLRDLPEAEQKDILFKQDWCLRFLKMLAEKRTTRGDGKMKAAIAAISIDMANVAAAKAQAGKKKMAGKRPAFIPPAPSTKYLRRWVNKLIAGNMNPLALRDQRCTKSGNWTSRFCAEVYAIMYQHASCYASPEQPSIRELHERMEIEITARNTERALENLEALEIPDYERFRQEVNNLDPFFVKAGREGIDVAKNYFRAVSSGLVDVVRPLQRVEIDEWTVHLHVLLIRAGIWETLSDDEKRKVERVRMVLCVAIDCATRCILAMSLSRTANPANAIRVLDMGLSEKQDYADAAGTLTPWDMYGTWETAVTDAGTSFANNDFCVRMIDAGITFEIAAAGVPFLRGTVERSLRSLDQKMIKRFAGRTGSNVKDKGEYDSQGRASLDLDELATALVRYQVDHYHNTPHAGLRGESPRACWLRLTEQFGVMPPPDPNKRRAIFGIPMRATADADGVRILGVQFQSREINELFMSPGSKEVEIRVDPKDMGTISAKIGGVWHEINGPEELRGIHVEGWIAAEAELRRRNADMSKLTRPIVLAAAKYLNDLADNGRQRVGIADRPISALALARAHRDMKLGVSFIKEANAAGEANLSLFDDPIMVVGGSGDHRHEPSNASKKLRKAAGKSGTAKPQKASSSTLICSKTKPRGWRYE